MIQEPVEKGVKGTNGCLASFIRREQGEHMNTPPLLCHFPKSSTHEDSQSFVGCVNGKKKKIVNIISSSDETNRTFILISVVVCMLRAVKEAGGEGPGCRV